MQVCVFVALEFVPLHFAVTIPDVALIPAPELVPVVKTGDPQAHPNPLVPLPRVDEDRRIVDRAPSGPRGSAQTGEGSVSVGNDGSTPTKHHLTLYSMTQTQEDSYEKLILVRRQGFIFVHVNS